MNDTPGGAQTDTGHARLVQELQRRIDALHSTSESEFGEFNKLDWLLCLGGFVVFPYLLYLWFWP